MVFLIKAKNSNFIKEIFTIGTFFLVIIISYYIVIMKIIV